MQKLPPAGTLLAAAAGINGGTAGLFWYETWSDGRNAFLWVCHWQNGLWMMMSGLVTVTAEQYLLFTFPCCSLFAFWGLGLLVCKQIGV